MNSIEILDLARKRAGIPSDRKLAKAIDMPESRVSHVRTGRRKIDGKMAVKLAELIGVPPSYILALVAAERAEDDDVAREWRRAARLLKKSAAAAIVASTLLVAAGPDAPAVGQKDFATEQLIHYAHLLAVLAWWYRRRIERAFCTGGLRSQHGRGYRRRRQAHRHARIAP